MFGNTFVLPHADGNITCIKINQDQYTSVYMFRNTVHEVRVQIRHQKTKVTAEKPNGIDRHNVEVTQRIFATSEAAEIFRKHYIVVEQAPDDVDVKLVDATADWLIATANSNVTSVLGWES